MTFNYHPGIPFVRPIEMSDGRKIWFARLLKAPEGVYIKQDLDGIFEVHINDPKDRHYEILLSVSDGSDFWEFDGSFTLKHKPSDVVYFR